MVKLEYIVEQEQEGQYLTVPFEMPPGTETFKLRYTYERYAYSPLEGVKSGFTGRQEINIIDLGLLDPTGKEVGVSGSDKTEIEIRETHATPGYHPWPLVKGRWQILLGAYKVAPGGVKVTYELEFTPKMSRWLKGDLHTHTLASDGVLTAEELGWRAKRHGLDFLAITDHNQWVNVEALPKIPGLTMIPGVEWTHFQGHASFLGVERPYDDPFFTNSFEEVQQRFQTARARGALITINHPFEEISPFGFDLEALSFDCLEIWNGPMRESNLRAIGLWQQLLLAGKKVPICGGSDYHRDRLFIFLGGPTTCVYTPSSSVPDILAALRKGHAYVVYAPDGPTLEVKAGEAMMGEVVPYEAVRMMEIWVENILAGDVIQVVTRQGSQTIFEAVRDGSFYGDYRMKGPGFARVEVLRRFVPGLPLLPAVVGNAVWFGD
jgi:hypothetical protein